jgi:hypothetical protein
MANAAARFDFGRGIVEETQDKVTLNAEYTPNVIKNIDTYRPAVFVSVMQRILPKHEIDSGTI